MRFLTVTLLLICVLAGCGTTATRTQTSTSTSVQQQARVVWLDYARCVRDHGHPDYPDPVVDSEGKPHFPASQRIKEIGNQMQGSCGQILGRLPAAATGRTPLTPAGLHQLVLFAGCIRHHGLPAWPDPRPDGSFRLAGTPYANMGKSAQVRAALLACQRYNAGGVIG